MQTTNSGACCTGNKLSIAACPNVGTFDRLLRAVIGIVLIVGVFAGPQTPWGWLGVPLIISAALGWCGLYQALGVNTCRCASKSGECCGPEKTDSSATGSCCSKSPPTP